VQCYANLQRPVQFISKGEGSYVQVGRRAGSGVQGGANSSPQSQQLSDRRATEPELAPSNKCMPRPNQRLSKVEGPEKRQGSEQDKTCVRHAAACACMRVCLCLCRVRHSQEDTRSASGGDRRRWYLECGGGLQGTGGILSLSQVIV